MTDTQADLTERADAVVDDWLWLHDGAIKITQDAIRNLRNDIERALQSEREAAVADARRAAIKRLLPLADKAKLKAHRNPGYVGVSMAVDDLHEAIVALASPAPQEETRNDPELHELHDVWRKGGR